MQQTVAQAEQVPKSEWAQNLASSDSFTFVFFKSQNRRIEILLLSTLKIQDYI